MRVKADNEGKTKDVSNLDVTPENFIVPTGTEHLYHCRIEIVEFDRKSGKRISKPRIQTFGKKFFETFGLHNLRQQGYTVDIMHDPKEWEKEHKAEAEAKAKAKAEAEAKAAEEAKEAERAALKEALKAEILAEMQAEAAGTQTADDEKKPGRKAKTE